MELAKHDSFACLVKTEDPHILVRFALRVLLLRGIDGAISAFDECRPQRPRVLPLDGSLSGLTLRGPLPSSDQELERSERISGRALLRRGNNSGKHDDHEQHR